MAGVFDETYSDFLGTQERRGITGPQDIEAGFGEIFTAAASHRFREGNIWSRHRARAPLLGERNDAYERLTGKSAGYFHTLDLLDDKRRQRLEGLIDGGEIFRGEDGEIRSTRQASGWLLQNKQAVTAMLELRDARQAFPGQILTDEEIGQKVAVQLAEVRERNMAVLARGRGGSAVAAEMLGVGAAAMADPELVASLFLGAGAIQGPSIAANALKAFAIEAPIAGATEGMAELGAFQFKREIGSPYTVKESAFNVLAATLGAGLIRSGGSVTVDVAERLLGRYGAEKVAGRIQPTGESEAAADALSAFIREKREQPWPDADPEAARDHDLAIQKAIDDLEDGQPVDVAAIVGDRQSPADPANNIPGGRMLTRDDLETFDPRELLVDAERFQFKAGGDAAGVTGAFRDIGRFELQQAGQVITYEDAAGRLFIVDGHQRMGIARRALEAGQDPETVALFGFRLRAADGVTPETARAVAAVKNIAEGSGSPIDAAKVFRELGDAGLSQMPALPSAGAVVRQGRMLARLADDAFMQVVNGVIPERYGALVGEIIGADARKQQAAIQILARTEPANEVQARQIVRDVNATELEETTTLDLFGEQVVSESLVLERAKVVDAAIKKLRAERSTFKTLVSRESAIQGKGANRLDRATNERIVDENEQVIQTLERQVNTKGPVSERLTEAARALKAGGKPETVVRDFLGDVGAAVAGGRGAGPVARRAGSGQLAPEVGRPLDLSALPEDSARAAERAFLDPQRGRTWNQMYSFAKKAQKALDRVAARIAKEVDGIEYKTPGLKDRKAAEARAAEKKKAPGEMKDIARGGFMLTDPEQAGAIIARLADEFEIIDEGWQVIATSGYFDRKLQVRDANGTVFEVQLWEPHLFDAKEFRGGHDLYNEARKLEIKDADGTRRAKQGSEAEYDRLTEAMRQLYADAMGEAPPVWRPLLERLQSGKAERSASGAQRANDSADMARPVVNRSMGEAENQPLSRSDQAKPAGVPSDDLPSTAGVPSQLKNDSISIESTSRPIIAEQDILSKAADEADLFSDVQYRQDLADAEDILARYDVDLPERIVVEDGAEVMELRPAREVLDGLDAEEKAIIDLHTCHRGSA